MKTKRSTVLRAVAAIGFAGLLVSTSASANGVYWSVGVSSPGVQVGVHNSPPPPRVYYVPQVVYGQPQVIYQQPQVVYVQPRPVYVQPQPIYYTPPAPVYYVPQQVQPRVLHGGWHHPRHGWQHPGHGAHPGWHTVPRVHGPAPFPHGRVAGVGHSNDQGRNHH